LDETILLIRFHTLMNKKFHLLFAFVVLFFQNHKAQQFERNYDLPVSVDGAELKNPWAGGLNSCQVSRLDVNMDGAKDLFIFDRIGSRISIYVNMNNTPGVIDYKYTLEYNHLFPTGLRNWVLLRDMNCDGKEDICANSGSGFKIYYNTSDVSLSFMQNGGANVQAYYDFGADAFYNSVYCISPDLPAFNDYDEDGDIDIWSWNEYSTSEFFYKNMAVENGTCETPDFVCRNRCYGKFGEGTESFEIFIGNQFECDFNVANPRGDETGPLRHTGGTTLAVDLDQNGFRDLIIGDATENSLAALMVGPPVADQDSVTFVHYDFPLTFGSTQQATMITFLGSFYEDINNDGIHDLFVSPNAYSDAEDKRSLMLYINNGLNDLPQFEFVQDNFLQSEMIDVGLNAYPVVFDLDQDGLKDMLVVNRKEYELGVTYTTRIQYYRNVGTNAAPSFLLEDENWLNVPALQLQSVYPAFGDLDGDDDSDLVLGDQEGVLRYFENTAGVGQPCIFVMSDGNIVDNTGNDLDVGQNATPQLVDLNEDGKNDLIIGELNGSVNYYENIGTPQDYIFQLIEDSIGNAVATSNLGIQGKSVPFMFKDGSGLWQLLIGTETGQINHYDEIEGNLLGEFHLVTNSYEGIFEGERCSIHLNDINSDGQLDLFVGNVGGGVGVYTHLPVGVNDQYYSQDIKLYPNPTRDQMWIEFPDKIELPVNIEIIDNTGRVVQSTQARSVRVELDLNSVANGLYLVRLTSPSFISCERMVVRK